MLMRSVKLNVTIPEWMKVRAETMDVNYSRILQGALMDLFDSPDGFRQGDGQHHRQEL